MLTAVHPRAALRAAALLPALALGGCHGLLLGEDFQTDTLPHRTVSAWPVVESEEDPATGERRTHALGGFIYTHKEPGLDASQAAAFPFFWHAREGEEARTRVPPFFFHSRDAAGSSTTAWPFAGVYRDADGSSRTSVLSELVSVGRGPRGRTDLSVPRGVLEYHRDGDAIDLWSMGYRGASLARWSESPGRRRGHVFPFIWHAADEVGPDAASSWLVAPLLYARRGLDPTKPDDVTLAALPGVYYHRAGRDSRLNWLGALLDIHTQDGVSGGHALGVGPVALASWRDDGERSRAHLFPFYWHGASPERDWSVLFPGYLRFADRTDGTQRTIVFPLVHRRTGPGDASRTDLLWPLYHHEQADEHREWSVLFHLARSTRDAPDQSDLRVLHKLFRHRRDGTRVETALNPLFSHSRDEALGFRAVSVLFGLYQYERRKEEKTHTFLWLLKV